MLDQEKFDKNIKRWSQFNPEASQLHTLTPKRVSFHSNSNGSLNLKTTIQDTQHYYHSLSSPEEEARNWFSELNLENIQVLFVHGVGLGYYYDAVKEWLRVGQGHYLVFLEQDLEVIQHLLRTARGTEIVHDPQVWLYYVDPRGSILDKLATYFAVKNELMSSLGLYCSVFSQSVHRMKARLSFYLDRKRGIIAEYSNSGKIFLSSYLRNALCLPKAHQGNNFYGKFHGIPAIICGAGPSLAKSLPLLSTLRDRALIFAGGTAMNALNTVGLLPHFGVGIDPNPAQYTRVIMNQAFETPFFYRNRMYYKALELVHGERLFSTGSGGHDIGHWFEEKLGIAGLDLSEGYNVLGFSIAIAEAMGCFPIILCGLDLAYTNDFSYCPGIANHPLHERKAYFRTKSVSDELISHTDIYGKPITTLWKWIAEAAWFSSFAQSHPHALVVNATEGGLGFDGIPNESLQHISNVFLKQQYDFSAILHSEIQNAAMPPEVSEANIIEILSDLLSSLERCSGACQILEEDLQRTIHTLDNNSSAKTPILSKTGEQALDSLQDESGYKHLLKVFNDMHVQIHSRQLDRLEIDKDTLSSQESTLRKAMIAQARYRSLKKTAKESVVLIEKILQEHTEREALLAIKQETPAPPPNKPHREPLPYTEAVSEKYADGSIKLVQFRKDGRLHGPSTYYSPNGAVLAQTWFDNGLQEGESQFFYPNGNIHSIQQFKNSIWHGEQRFWYADGSLKTSMRYLQGELDGPVRLYYPNGALQRELHFSRGKRHGIERMWSLAGTLILEAEFDMDRPSGKASEWHSNGQLAKEVTYQKNSLKYTIEQWNPEGEYINRAQQGEQDYFDAVAKRTGDITTSLGIIVEHLAPGFGDFETLKQGMAGLQDLQKKLLDETGFETIRNEESLWKNPANQREAQREIQRMTEDLAKQMQTLQSTLENTMKQIHDKMKRNDNSK